MDVPRPNDGSRQQRHHKSSKNKRLFEKKDTRHEDEENDNSPDEADECDGPGLALRFVRFVEHCNS
jgi:hypothetical protein